MEESGQHSDHQPEEKPADEEKPQVEEKPKEDEKPKEAEKPKEERMDTQDQLNELQKDLERRLEEKSKNIHDMEVC